MKKRMIWIGLILLAISGRAQENNWELEKEKNGIKVWTRRLPDSKLKEYKRAVTLNTTVDKLVTVFKNTKYHEKIFYKCRPGSVVIIKKISDADFYTYMIINTPIVKDRDVVTHYTISEPEGNGAVTINLDGAANMVPVKEDFVRVPKMKGYWKFIPQGVGKVLVVHQAYSAPGGSVPDGLVNSSAVDVPFDMLTTLQTLFP